MATSESIFNLAGKMSNPRQKRPAVFTHGLPAFGVIISYPLSSAPTSGDERLTTERTDHIWSILRLTTVRDHRPVNYCEPEQYRSDILRDRRYAGLSNLH